jgi:hypothetical protein
MKNRKLNPRHLIQNLLGRHVVRDGLEPSDGPPHDLANVLDNLGHIGVVVVVVVIVVVLVGLQSFAGGLDVKGNECFLFDWPKLSRFLKATTSTSWAHGRRFESPTGCRPGVRYRYTNYNAVLFINYVIYIIIVYISEEMFPN